MNRLFAGCLAIAAFIVTVNAQTPRLGEASGAGQDPRNDPILPIPFEAPFASPTLKAKTEKAEVPALKLIVVTDDDPYATSSANIRDADQQPWCQHLIKEAVREALRDRPDLRQNLAVQLFGVGLPIELLGGSDSSESQPSLPSRAITIVCDGRYRFLSFVVGVPDGDQILSLIEDAEESRTLAEIEFTLAEESVENEPQATDDAARQLFQKLHERSSGRVHRVYREQLVALAETLDTVSFDESPEPALLIRSQHEVYNVLTKMDRLYQVDVQLRFGLSGPTDLRRRLTLEQHVQTRREWSDCVATAMTYQDVRTLISPMVECLWGYPPSPRYDRERRDNVKDLMKWVDFQEGKSRLVFTIDVPRSHRFDPWPPVAEQPKGLNAKRTKGLANAWQRSIEKASQYPIRRVGIHDLAQLIREKGYRRVDIRPTLANGSVLRYAVLDPDRGNFVLVRDIDPPSLLLRAVK